MKRFWAAPLLALLAPLAAMAAPKKEPAKTESNPTASVLDPKATGLSAEEADILGEAVRDAVVASKRYRVQDRATMKEILTQQKFNVSDACDESCAVQAGRLLQVRYLISSTLRRVDDEIWIAVRMTDVESGEVLGAVRGTCKCAMKEAVKEAEQVTRKVLGGERQEQAAEALPAAPPAVRSYGQAAKNTWLDEARKRASRGQYAACLEELDLAEGVLDNSVRQWADVYALKATCNLLKKPADERAARLALVEFLHYDPSGELGNLPELVAQKLAQVKAEKVAILHSRLVIARMGRPVRVKARVNDPKSQVAGVTLFHRLKSEEAYKSNVLDRGPSDFSGYVRSAPPDGTEGDVLVEYYLSATDSEGQVLDMNGTAARPITFQLSSTLAEQEGAGAVQTLAFSDEDAIRPPPPPAPPFYTKWWFWTAVAVVVGGGTTAFVVASRPEPAQGSLGRIDLP